MRVVGEVLTAVEMACDACVRQEKEGRDRYLSTIDNTKVTGWYILLNVWTDIYRPTYRKTD